MTVRAAVIRQDRPISEGKPMIVGLVLHDERSGRVVMKTDPRSPLQKALTAAVGGLPGLSVVVHEVMGETTVRRRLLPSHAAYFPALLEQVILAPFVVSEIRESNDRLDQAADNMANELGIVR